MPRTATYHFKSESLKRNSVAFCSVIKHKACNSAEKKNQLATMLDVFSFLLQGRVEEPFGLLSNILVSAEPVEPSQ